MTLLILFALLIVPFLIMRSTLRIRNKLVASQVGFRAGLSVFFAFTGVGHFLKTQEMSLMLGEIIPNPQLVVQVTGGLEVLAAVGIWLPRWRQVTGYCLVGMMVAFLPINVFAAINQVPFGGHELGPVYLLVRVPFQIFVIWWICQATSIKPSLWMRAVQQQTGPQPWKGDTPVAQFQLEATRVSPFLVPGSSFPARLLVL